LSVSPPPIPPRVAVAVPATQHVDIRWHANFARIISMCPPGSGQFYANRYGVAETREDLINQFLNMPDFTHLLFYDTDVIPMENHAVATLLNDNLPVVSGIYFNSLYTGLAAWVQEKPLTWAAVQGLPNPIIEVDKCGAGFLLMKRDVFKLLVSEERPWFYYKMSGGDMMSEDFYFFYSKLLKVGIKPFVDTRVRCQHLKTCMVNPDGTVAF
jgi:hypothetical protein